MEQTKSTSGGVPHGEMVRRVAEFDWSKTPLGARAGWPVELRVAVDICLSSRFPMFVWWGPELINIYNDGYVPMLGKRHPAALGRPAHETWSEIWDVVGPQADAVMLRGESTWNERVKLVMERKGFREETYFTWSYSPIWDGTGNVRGLYCAVSEETEHVRAEAERDRLAAQRQLALDSARLGWWHYDPATKVATYDRRYSEIFGVEGMQRPNEEILKRLHPDDLPGVWEKVEAALDPKARKPYSAEFRIVRDGAIRWIEAYGSATFEGEDGAQRAKSFVGTVADITERKWAEQFVAAQSRALELVATGAPLCEALGVLTTVVEEQSGGQAIAAVLLVDSDGCSLRTGAAPSLPAEYCAAIDGIKAKAGLGTCADAAARNEVVCTPDLEAAPSWKGLSHLPLGIGLKGAWSMPIRGTDGKVLGTFGTYFRECREPTAREREVVHGMCRVAALAIERRQAEAALRQSEGRLREMADAMPQMVWVTRPDGYHEYYNRRWYEFTGVPEGSTDGEGWSGLFHPDDQPRAWERWRRSLATGEPYEVEYRLRHHSGEYRWTLGRALPIRNAQGEIERWFGTCTDIHAMKRLTAEREHLLERERAARDEAEAANRAKDRFLAVLSHELRTPLSPVVMAIPAMELDPELPFKFREELAMVRRNIDLEVKLIDDLLDLSRVTSGKLRLNMQPVRVHDLLRHAVRSIRGDTGDKHLEVRHELEASNDRLVADPARLQQVFWNLLRNAVKFTPDGGEIVVRTRDGEDGELVVAVSDSGIGIPHEMLPRVFDAFEQGDVRMTRQFGGMGLGLAIAKAVIEMHGGTIAAASEGSGRGATFTVRLATAHATQDSREDVPGTARRAPGGAQKPRVLLVEDHPDTARTLGRLLEASGYDVKTAHSVASALKAAGEHTFDLVVSDIGLPDATGYELMEQVRDRHGLRGIALSGYGMEDDMRRSREAGFVEHVVKPVNVAQLEAVIQRVIEEGRAG